LGPCKSSISLRNSENIKLISASQQFLCRSTNNSYLSIFCITTPTFEECNDIKLSCFNSTLSNNKELFQHADLNIWENKWSEYNVFSMNSTVDWSQRQNHNEIFRDIIKLLEDNIQISTSINYIPFTNGMSFDYMNKPNCLFFIDLNKINDNAYKLIDHDNLIKEDCHLIKTNSINRTDNVSLIDDLASMIGNPEIKDFLIDRENTVCIWIISPTNNFSLMEEFQSKNQDITYFISDNIKDIKPAINKLYESFIFK